jgi:N-[(2S)-2-amino-2-carboxyethyl]-L-glutamate dehydrogenase
MECTAMEINTKVQHNSKHEILFLSLEQVIELGGARVDLAAKDLEEGFHLLANKNVLQPFKTTLKPSHKGHEYHQGLVNFLPTYIEGPNYEIYGCKALGAMPKNVEQGIPRATGIITLFDPVTKTPTCIMDAQVISATRTGAVSYLATKKLVNYNATEIGLIGAGVNMRTQLTGVKLAHPKLQRAYVYSRGESKYLFAKEMSHKLEMDVIAVESAQEAVKNKLIVITCLPNVAAPVVKADWIVDRGITQFNIGCYESETSLLKRMDRVIADIWEQGKHRGVQTHAIAVQQGIISENIIEDFCPIVIGEKVGRTREDENIFFAPTGLGFEDVIVAHRIYKEALRQNIGTKLPLWNSSNWI